MESLRKRSEERVQSLPPARWDQKPGLPPLSRGASRTPAWEETGNPEIEGLISQRKPRKPRQQRTCCWSGASPSQFLVFVMSFHWSRGSPENHSFPSATRSHGTLISSFWLLVKFHKEISHTQNQSVTDITHCNFIDIIGTCIFIQSILGIKGDLLYEPQSSLGTQMRCGSQFPMCACWGDCLPTCPSHFLPPSGCPTTHLSPHTSAQK